MSIHLKLGQASRPALRELWSALAITAILICGHASPQVQDERTVKAAFVFNLTKYVEWPKTGKELRIGVVGEGPMGDTLKRLLEGRKSEDRLIHVLVWPTDQEIDSCAMLYFTQSPAKQTQSKMDRVRHKSVLTVGESEPFVVEGGMVGLVREGDSIQIVVNLEAAQAGNLNISSRLLNLSRIVGKPGGKS